MKKQISRLGKNSVIYGVGSTLTKFIHLLLLPLFTAYLTPADYGVLALLALLSMVAQPVFSLGMSAAMGPSYFEGNDHKRKSQTVWTSFLILAVSSMLLLVIAWSFPDVISLLVLQSEAYSLMVSLTLSSCVMTILSTPFRQRLQFEESARAFVAISLASSIASIALSVIAVVFLGWGVQGMVISQLLGQTLLFLMFALVGTRETKIIIDKTIGRELLHLGVPLVPSFAFLFILMQGNRYLLQWFDGVEQVGIFSVGFNLGLVLNIVVGAISTAWYPFFMSYLDKQAEAEELFGKIFTYYIFFVGYLWLCFFIFAKPVVMVMTTTDFYSSYLVIGLVAGSYFCLGIYGMLLPGMYFNKQVSVQSLVHGVAAAISIVINVVLIKSFGLFGAAVGLFLGHLLIPVFTYAWNFYKRSEYLNIKYQWRRLLCYSSAFFVTPFLCLLYSTQNLTIEICRSFVLLTVLSAFLLLNLNKAERAQLRSPLNFIIRM